MNEQNSDNFMQATTPADTLNEVLDIFDPTLMVDPQSIFYIPRRENQIQKLEFDLKNSKSNKLHAFLCGHRGSGKTTELKRLSKNKEIISKYETIYLTAQNFGSEAVHLTHDALLVGIGRELQKRKDEFGIKEETSKQFENWGKQIVKTFLHDERVKAEVGAKADAWFTFFKATLSSRREWKIEQKQLLEPKVQDLVGILNLMSQELVNHTGKHLLVIVDDLEKGESDAHKEMHTRLFEEYYDILIQPRFSIIYTLPIYFRSKPGSRIENEFRYDFSAIHLYEIDQKKEDHPKLAKDNPGYSLIQGFVEKRINNIETLFDDDVLDELLLIGGGLFRETARAVREAAYFALIRGGNTISKDDVAQVFNQIKKEYQPIIRGKAIKILHDVLQSDQGWVEDVEPYLQSRAVVEYENGDLWLDLRYVLKPYVKSLKIEND